MSEVIKTIANLESMRVSVNGNPRWRIRWTDGTENTTQPDASVAYGLDNSEFKNVPLAVTIKRGQVTHVRVLSD